MRKLGLFIIAIAALAFMPAVSWAGILGTAHDLSGAGYGTDQICVFCHTPHNAQATQLVPLWNHASTTATFTTYTSETLNAALGQPAGVSKACLSCHDGTVALDSYGSGPAGSNYMADGPAKLGTDLGNDHPISFTYNGALATADGGLVTPTGASEVVAGIPLYNEQLECASCHNVHDDTANPFLRFANTGSALCLKCHNK